MNNSQSNIKRIAIIQGCFHCPWKNRIAWRTVCTHPDAGMMDLCPEREDVVPGFICVNCPLMTLETFRMSLSGPTFVPLPMAMPEGRTFTDREMGIMFERLDREFRDWMSKRPEKSGELCLYEQIYALTVSLAGLLNHRLDPDGISASSAIGHLGESLEMVRGNMLGVDW